MIIANLHIPTSGRTPLKQKDCNNVGFIDAEVAPRAPRDGLNCPVSMTTRTRKICSVLKSSWSFFKRFLLFC